MLSLKGARARFRWWVMTAIVKPASISWFQVFKRTWTEATKDDVLGRSAELSYYFFLSLFPLLICVLAFLGIFSETGEHVRHELSVFLGRMLPGSASELVWNTLAVVSKSQNESRASLGLLLSLWSASAGMSAVMNTLNAAYEVQETRSFMRRNAIAIGLTIIAGALMVAAVGIVVIGVPSAEVFARGVLVVLLKIVEWPVATLLVLLGFAIIYFAGPDVKYQKWHWVTPGAIIGLILWLVASIGLKAYLHFFNSFNTMYGPLGAVIILLLWFYLTGISVLLGAEINTVIENAAAEEGVPDAKLKGEKVPRAAAEQGGV
jgi:membrane protein